MEGKLHMCKYSSNKELNGLIRKLVSKGWTYEHLSKHGRLITPCGGWCTTISISPSSRNAAKHLKWDISKYAKLISFTGKEFL